MIVTFYFENVKRAEKTKIRSAMSGALVSILVLLDQDSIIAIKISSV